MKLRATLSIAILSTIGLAFAGGVVTTKILLNSSANATQTIDIPGENARDIPENYFAKQTLSMCDSFTYPTEEDWGFDELPDPHIGVMKNQKYLCQLAELEHMKIDLIMEKLNIPQPTPSISPGLQSRRDNPPLPGFSITF